MDLQVLKILFTDISRTCKRVDQDALSSEEMAEIEEELRMRRELLERKCQLLENEKSLPNPKKYLSHLRYIISSNLGSFSSKEMCLLKKPTCSIHIGERQACIQSMISD